MVCPKKPVVFFDFDNTITINDVLDSVIERFAKDERWRVLEQDWMDGKIGSRECLKGQVECLRVTKRSLDKYLSGVRIDPGFKRLVRHLRSRNARTIIVSDNFDYMLSRILEKNGISEVDSIYCNKLGISKDTLVPRFPLTNSSCGECAHCKKSTLLANVKRESSVVYYIGDGKSDLCVSKVADIVFAKGRLKEYCEKERMAHVPFEQLGQVYDYLKERL